MTITPMNLVPEFEPGKDIIIILNHNAALFTIDSELDPYFFKLTDKRLDDPMEWLNQKTYLKIFLENITAIFGSGKQLVLLEYNPLLVGCLKIIKETSKKAINICFFCIAFFHSDKDTASIRHENNINTLGLKTFLLENMADYPFIKKFNVPLNHNFDYTYLKNLLKRMV